MSELKTNLEQILQEKNEKIISQNIKKDIEVLGVTGSYDKEDIKELQDELADAEQELADVRRDLDNSTATISGSGETVTLNGTAEARFKKLGVSGNSEQETTEGKNLANDNDMLLGYWAYADGTYIRTNTWICTPKIACKGNVDYTFQFANNSRWYGFVWYDENNNFISTANQQNNLQTGFRSFTAKSPSNAGYLVINIAGYPGTNDTIRTDDLINFQVEEGSTATSYEPYTGGEASPSPDYPQEITNVTGDVEVVVENKNLIDYKTVENTSNTTVQLIDNGFKVTGKYAGKIVIENLKPNTNYYLQYIRKNIIGTATTVTVFAGTLQSTVITSMQNSSYFNTGENTTINIWFYASMGGIDGETNFTNIQLEESTTATDYVEHQHQTFTFPLGNEKLMLGDYLADDGIHHVRGQLVLDGTEIWADFNYTSGDNNFRVQNQTPLPNVLTPPTNPAKLLCNYFKAVNRDNAYVKSVVGIAQYGGNLGTIFLSAPISILETQDMQGWKNWLSTHNTIVEYEVETEEIVPYTSAQQEVYNQIKQALSYDKQTTVSGISSGASPRFDIIALRNMNDTLNTLENDVDLLE